MTKNKQNKRDKQNAFYFEKSNKKFDEYNRQNYKQELKKEVQYIYSHTNII